MGPEDRQATPSGRSWMADALDPVENLRALADVQAFGRRAAEDLADRILAWGDSQGTNGSSGPSGNGTAGNGAGPTGSVLAAVIEQMRGDAVLAGEVSARLVEHTMMLLGILIERLPVGPRTEDSAPEVVLVSARAGYRGLGGVLGAQHLRSRGAGGPAALPAATVAPRPGVPRGRRRVRPARSRSPSGPQQLRDRDPGPGARGTPSPVGTSRS